MINWKIFHFLDLDGPPKSSSCCLSALRSLSGIYRTSSSDSSWGRTFKVTPAGKLASIALKMIGSYKKRNIYTTLLKAILITYLCYWNICNLNDPIVYFEIILGINNFTIGFIRWDFHMLCRQRPTLFNINVHVF